MQSFELRRPRRPRLPRLPGLPGLNFAQSGVEGVHDEQSRLRQHLNAEAYPSHHVPPLSVYTLCHYTPLPRSFLTRFTAIFGIGCEAAICEQEAEAFRHSLQELTEVSLCSAWTNRELDTTRVTT